ILPADPERSLHAQYEGYRAEAGGEDSRVETFASLTLESKLPGYEGIPMTLTTGKALDEKQTYVRVHFKQASHHPSGVLQFGVYPETRVSAKFVSGEGVVGEMLQEIDEYSLKSLKWDGYTAIFTDAIAGDKTYFASSEEVLASWQVLEPI